MRINARQQVLCRTLNETMLAKALRRLLPRRNEFGSIDYADLVEELQIFGIANLRQLRRLVLEHRRKAIRIDSEPFDAVNTGIQRKELGNHEFNCRQRRQVFYNYAGLVRMILELHFGERYRQFSEARRHK